MLFCVLTGLCIAVAMRHSIRVQLLRPFRNSGAVRGRQSHGVFIKHTGKGQLFRVRLRRPQFFHQGRYLLQLRCRCWFFRCSYAAITFSFFTVFTATLYKAFLFHHRYFIARRFGTTIPVCSYAANNWRGFQIGYVKFLTIFGGIIIPCFIHIFVIYNSVKVQWITDIRQNNNLTNNDIYAIIRIAVQEQSKRNLKTERNGKSGRSFPVWWSRW